MVAGWSGGGAGGDGEGSVTGMMRPLLLLAGVGLLAYAVLVGLVWWRLR